VWRVSDIFDPLLVLQIYMVAGAGMKDPALR